MPFFSPKTWKQRIVEFPGRRRLDDTSSADVYDVSRAEGTVTQEGDGFTAANMNDLEQRIYSAVNEIVEIEKVVNGNQADLYSPDETYTAGRLVINNNALWKAKQDIDVAEPWTPDHWDPTTLAAELKAQAEDISDLNSRTTFAEYSNVDLNMVNEYCFVVINSNSESYNAPSVGRYLCTPQAIGFQIGIDMNAGNFYARGHNWGGFSDWRSFSFS